MSKDWWKAFRGLILDDTGAGDYSQLDLPRPKRPGAKHSASERDQCDQDDDCQYEPCWISTDDWCNDILMEGSWKTEGFKCCLPQGHDGPHAHFTTHQEDLVGEAADGRPYHWSHVWSYDGDQK